MRIHSLYTDIPKPERFTYPFCYEPHPLCQLAAKEVQEYIASHEVIRDDADNGKMFGVLIVESPGVSPPQQGESEGVFFLAAYSGLLAGRNDWDYFVPPVFDAQQPDGYFKTKEREIKKKKNVPRPPVMALPSVSVIERTGRVERPGGRMAGILFAT